MKQQAFVEALAARGHRWVSPDLVERIHDAGEAEAFLSGLDQMSREDRDLAWLRRVLALGFASSGLGTLPCAEPGDPRDRAVSAATPTLLNLPMDKSRGF